MVQQATSVPQEELAPAIARIYAKQQAFFASGQNVIMHSERHSFSACGMR